MSNVQQIYRNAVNVLRSEMLCMEFNSIVPSENELNDLDSLLDSLVKNQSGVRKEYSEAESFLKRYKN
jgi:hypothetical protein